MSKITRTQIKKDIKRYTDVVLPLLVIIGGIYLIFWLITSGITLVKYYHLKTITENDIVKVQTGIRSLSRECVLVITVKNPSNYKHDQYQFTADELKYIYRKCDGIKINGYDEPFPQIGLSAIQLAIQYQ